MEEAGGSTQPLLNHPAGDDGGPSPRPRHSGDFFAFGYHGHDIEPIAGVRDFHRELKLELRKLIYLSAPAIFTAICQFSQGAITQAFAGHVGTLDLAAFSIENSVIAGLSFGVMWGMGSALETLCGQAYGAGQMEMMGVYMQRSWVILLGASIPLTFLYVFAEPVLRALGQKEDISRAAARFALWMIPQLYAYALNFPIVKFLQAQSKVMAMAYIALAALVIHVFFTWLLVVKLGWGMVGAAVVLNGTWWFSVVAQMAYVVSGACGSAWSGLSWRAFHNLWGFVKLSLTSAVMLCLEVWYLTALLLFAGFLKNAEIAVDALSICLTISQWVMMIAVGLNAGVSVRVSNELGAGHPRAARFSMVVVMLTAFVSSLVVAVIILIFHRQYPYLFAESPRVTRAVYQLTPLLVVSIIINNIQPALSGVAVGAGWQKPVAFVNIVCYYIFGIPLGLVMGYVVNLGVQGIWIGMLIGTLVQTLCLFVIVYQTNWNKEASVAVERISKWGGEPAHESNGSGIVS